MPITTVHLGILNLNFSCSNNFSKSIDINFDVNPPINEEKEKREEKGDFKTRVLTVRSNQNNSYTSKKKVQFSKDSSDEEKSEELDYQSDDEEMVEVKTNRISSGVWKYFKRLSSEVGNYTVCQVDGCGKKYVYLTSTYNMNNHLISTHKIQTQEEQTKSSGSQIKKLDEFLQKTSSSIVLTTDCWKSNQNYYSIGVTAHFLDRKFEKKNFSLKSRQLTGGKTSKNIPLFVQDIMSEFNIVEKINMW
ncbi:hypothetical protein BpHYR1_009452 [Brachionus plicatilis]|uniref:BED-type domain-containing protein n=1 Tax=Brachionus plicatilis TaxID=10195 RepID=A0A3M7QE58_BRAPC|nr:hypothetical protein BpHYR1_009452 [Brachionus plicatilis]